MSIRIVFSLLRTILNLVLTVLTVASLFGLELILLILCKS